MDLTAKDFVDKTCVIYGATGTGKTTIIRHILWLLRGTIPVAFAFSQSDKDNHAYSTNLIPRMLVYGDVNEDVIQQIEHRQTDANDLWDRANKINALRSIALRVCTDAERVAIAEYAKVGETLVTGSESMDIHENRFRIFLKKIMRREIARIDYATLKPNEQLAVHYRDFTPRVVLVFDDCTSSWAALKNKPSIGEIFYRGRHMRCTIILAIHSDSVLSPMMRQNIRVSYFTDKISATQYAQRASNALPENQKNTMASMAQNICDRDAPYTKLAFVDGRCSLFSVPTHPDFSAVSKFVRDFCESVEKKNEGDEMVPWMLNVVPKK